MIRAWHLKAYPAAFCTASSSLLGDGVVLPDRLLADIQDIDVTGICFRIEGECGGPPICAIPSMFAEDRDDAIYMPNWMFENLYLAPGDRCEISLMPNPVPKAVRVALQPHDSLFLTLPDPKGLLETALGDFQTLTAHTVVTIDVLGDCYALSVHEVEPASPFVSVVDTDVVVDFVPPIDYVEPKPDEWPEAEPWPLANGVHITEKRLGEQSEFVLSDGRTVKEDPKLEPPPPPRPAPRPASQTAPRPASQTALQTEEMPSSSAFVPFSGQGHRLGK